MRPMRKLWNHSRIPQRFVIWIGTFLIWVIIWLPKITEWRDEAQANRPLVDECPATVVPPVEDIQEVLAPLPDSLPEQVIEGEQEPAIKPVKSDASIEQIDNLDGIVDRQK